jgi:uncharacterized membrane protein
MALTIPAPPVTKDRTALASLRNGLWWAARAAGLLTLGIVATLRAVHKPLWFDEIFTRVLAGMPTPAEVVEALRTPVDAMPPLYYFICRAGMLLLPDDHLGIRLPSVIGFLVAVWAVFAFLSSRVDRLSALTGAVFVACTALADYAYEARPYALMTGSVGCAVLAWQRVDRSPVWPIALACSLGLAVSCHYYAVFVWPAFALAELLVLVCERRCRIGVWLALVIGLIPFVVCWPLLASVRSAIGQHGQHWWGASRMSYILSSPQVLSKWSGGMWGPALTAALAAVCMLWTLRGLPIRVLPAAIRLPPSPLTAGECGLTVGLLAVPVVAVVVTMATGGAMSER